MMLLEVTLIYLTLIFHPNRASRIRIGPFEFAEKVHGRSHRRKAGNRRAWSNRKSLQNRTLLSSVK